MIEPTENKSAEPAANKKRGRPKGSRSKTVKQETVATASPEKKEDVTAEDAIFTKQRNRLRDKINKMEHSEVNRLFLNHVERQLDLHKETFN